MSKLLSAEVNLTARGRKSNFEKSQLQNPQVKWIYSTFNDNELHEVESVEYVAAYIHETRSGLNPENQTALF